MGQRRSLRTFLAMFLIIFMLGISIEVFSQVINSIRATNVSQLVVDNNNNGLADGGDVIQYTVEIANCSGTSIGGVNYQSDLDPNTSLVPNSVQVTTSGTSLCGDTSTPVDPPPPPPPPPANPIVTTTTPADGATEVALNTNLTITFSEAVTVTGDWVEMVCTTSGTFNPVALANLVVTGGPITYTLDPNVDLQVGETCAVTVYATGVVDTEALSPLANFAFSFVTETPPTVTTTSPANGAVGVATTDDIVITFDEPVTVTAASFTLECPATVVFAGGFAVSGSGTNIITVNPTGNLPAGTSCEVVIIAANTSDLDPNDPPDLLDGDGDNIEGDNYTFSFTTDVDAAPFVQTINPADGAVSVPNNTAITITFSELVDISSAADFGLECGGVPQGYTVTTPATLPASTTTVVITPAGNLPDAETCQVAVFTTVTDTDANDPPNNMVANFISTFTTEAPPAVTTTTPINGATGVSSGTNIVVNFDEPVNVTLSSFTIVCTNGGNRPFTFTGDGTNSITLDPATNLQANDSCTVTVVANQVSDVDPIDPPNNMVADYVFSFATVADTAPTVLNTTPADLATGVATASNIVINFSEPVDVTAGAFTLECASVGVPFTVIPALPTTNQTSFTLDPTGNLPAGTSCTVDVASANVTDTDTDEPPDNMVADYQFTFDTIVDLAPTVINTTPADLATGVTTGSNIVINFSEPVDVTAGAFTLECASVGVPFTVIPALPITNQTSFTLDPTGNLPATSNCVVTVLAANVTDTDTDEPPNNMVANYVFSFDTIVDLAPTVNQAGILPASTSGGANTASLNNDVSTTPTITIPFSESVDLLAGAFTLNCGAPVAITVSPVLPATNTSFDISPTAPLAEDSTCVLTVVSALVSDTDTDDPPNLMVADYTVTFNVDKSPAILTTTPANSAINVPLATNITLNFDELVTFSGALSTLDCGAGAIPYSIAGSGTATITLDPTPATLPLNTVCTVTIVTTDVADVDAGDPPNTLSVNVVFSFTTSNDVPPQVTTTTPTNGATGIGTGTNITINFNENVDINAGGITIQCPVPTPVTFSPVLPLLNVNNIVVDPAPPLPDGTICTVTVVATNVTDVDGTPDQLDGDNNGTGGDNYVFTFTTDTAPTVTTTTPTNGATGVTADSNIVVNFSEPVNATNTAFTLECPLTVPVTLNPADVTGTGTATITINPSVNLPSGVGCVVTVIATNVTDVDAGDPPDTMTANFVFSFSTDAPPTVTNTAPTDLLTGVATTNNIVIDFSENVDIGAGAITVDCGFGAIPFTPALPLLNTPTININPDVDLPINTVCTVTVASAGITDSDLNDPPNNMVADYVFSFTTDAPPSVIGANPINGATNVASNSNIVITFSEPVTVSNNSFTIECPIGSPITLLPANVTGSGTAVITIDPPVNLTGGQICTVTVVAIQVSDVDAGDPPDNMSANEVISFSVAATANDDAYTVTPHLTFTSPLSVRANDDPATVTVTGYGDTIGTANGTIPNGTNSIDIVGAGRVIMNADGTFVFYPDAGVTTGTFSFFYTITGGDTAQVDITFDGQEMIWFVNLATPTLCIIPNNIGTQACPDSDTNLIATQDTANDTIFFAQAGADYFCVPLTLETGGRVAGDGSTSTLSAISGVTPVAGSTLPTFTGTHPVLNNAPGDCITLSSNNRIDGITIRDTTGYAIASAVNIGTTIINRTNIIGTGGILNLTGGGIINAAFVTLSSSSHTGRVINLTNMAGAINNTGGAISNSANSDTIAVTGGTVSLTLFSTVSKTDGTGSLLNVAAGHNTGTLNFVSGISHSSATGSGVQFNDADGNYIVNGNLNISAGTAGVRIDNGSSGTMTFVSVGSSITNVTGVSFRINSSTAAVDYNGSITHTASAANGILIVDSTGTISFDGNVQIGTVANPMVSAVGVLLNNTGVVNLISFANLNIITGTGGGAGSQAFVSETSGRIAVTTGSIDCNGNIGVGNHCFDVSNTTSNGVTFATFLSDHDDAGEAGGAIFLNNTTGSFTFESFVRMTGFNTIIIEATNFGALNIGTVGTGQISLNGAAAVDIDNGAINITATSISMFSGAANGIIIQNTTGTFTVTGDGGAVANGSGGLIDNTTNDAVVLNNTAGLISLNYMTIEDVGDMAGGMNTLTGHNAIDGVNVNGGLSLNRTIIRRISDQAIFGGTFGSPDTATVWNGLSITNSLIENTNRYHVANIGDANNEGMIRILGIRGTVNITNSTLQDGAEMLDFFVTAGTLNLNVTGSTFNRSYKEFTSGVLASVGNHCIDVVVQGAGNANVTVGSRTVPANGNDFLNCRIGSIRVVNDAGSTGNTDFIVANNDFVVNDHSSGIGGDFDFPQGGVLATIIPAGGGTMDVIVENNLFDEITNATGGVGQLSLAIDNGTMQARVIGNTFDTPGNAPWWVVARGGNGTVEFVDNEVIQGFFACPDVSCEDFLPPAGGYNGPGLRALFDAQNGSILNVTMDNNVMAEHDTGFDPGQTVEFRALAGANTMCVALTDNQSPDGYSLEHSAGTFNLDNGTDAFTGACSAAQCQTVLQTNNNRGGAGVGTTNPPFVNVLGTVNVVNATCPTPVGAIFP